LPTGLGSKQPSCAGLSDLVWAIGNNSSIQDAKTRPLMEKEVRIFGQVVQETLAPHTQAKECERKRVRERGRGVRATRSAQRAQRITVLQADCYICLLCRQGLQTWLSTLQFFDMWCLLDQYTNQIFHSVALKVGGNQRKNMDALQLFRQGNNHAADQQFPFFATRPRNNSRNS
jgi:hypothetical protein